MARTKKKATETAAVELVNLDALVAPGSTASTAETIAAGPSNSASAEAAPPPPPDAAFGGVGAPAPPPGASAAPSWGSRTAKLVEDNKKTLIGLALGLAIGASGSRKRRRR